jgi:hypothetical protein
LIERKSYTLYLYVRRIKMKRFILICIVVCLFAGQASAALYEVTKGVASTFRQVSVSSGDIGNLGLVVDDLGWVYYWDMTVPSSYGSINPMIGRIGYVGSLGDNTQDNSGMILVGTTQAGTVTGTFNGLRAFVANDNDDPWDVALWVDDGSGPTFSSFTTLTGGDDTWINYAIGSTDFSGLNIGIAIKGDFSGTQPSNPDIFHVSVVPAPAAVLLGILGLGVAGLKLRKHA